MSKLFVFILLLTFVIPGGVCAATTDSSCACGTANTTSSGTWACGMMAGPGMMSGSDACSCGEGNVSACNAIGLCGMTGQSCTTRNNGSCSMTSGSGILTSGSGTGSCGNGGINCSFGMNGQSCSNNNNSTCGMMGGEKSDSDCEMMEGSGYQASAAGAGISGWFAAGSILSIIMILVWIIAGIMLIFVLYRKLSTK